MLLALVRPYYLETDSSDSTSAVQYLILGTLLLASSTFSKQWFYAAWVKVAFWILFVATAISIGLTFLLAHHAFSHAAFWAVYTSKTVFFGVAIGMLFLFFLSGEAARGYRCWHEHKKVAPTATSKI